MNARSVFISKFQTSSNSSRIIFFIERNIKYDNNYGLKIIVNLMESYNEAVTYLIKEKTLPKMENKVMERRCIINRNVPSP